MLWKWGQRSRSRGYCEQDDGCTLLVKCAAVAGMGLHIDRTAHVWFSICSCPCCSRYIFVWSLDCSVNSCVVLSLTTDCTLVIRPRSTLTFNTVRLDSSTKCIATLSQSPTMNLLTSLTFGMSLTSCFWYCFLSFYLLFFDTPDLICISSQHSVIPHRCLKTRNVMTQGL